MAGARDIKNKIRSVQNTQKITRAMEMVAASKMRKAQDRMAAARPYAEKMRNVIAHVSAASLEYRHPFLVEREMKRAGVIVVSSDRGLCGGLNNNLFRMLIRQMDEWRAQGVERGRGVQDGKPPRGLSLETLPRPDAPALREVPSVPVAIAEDHSRAG